MTTRKFLSIAKEFLFVIIIISITNCNSDINREEKLLKIGDQVFDTENPILSKGYAYAVNVGDLLSWNTSIPYVFRDNVVTNGGVITDEQKRIIREAMDEWQSNVGVFFHDITDQFDPNEVFLTPFVLQIYIDNSIAGAGEATVGWQLSPYVKFKDYYSLDSIKGTMRHELGHVLGLLHEHQRFDRNDYIFVDYDNISSDWHDQYDIIDNVVSYTVTVPTLKCAKKVWGICYWWEPVMEEQTVEFEVAYALTDYDYESIMHYPCYKDGDFVLWPLNVSEQEKINMCNSTIGQRSHLSSSDIASAQAIYGPPCDPRPCVQNSCLDKVYGPEHCLNRCY